MEKLLLLTDWFYPGFKAGGPIKSTTNISEALSDKLEIFVFTSDRDLNDKKPYSQIATNKWQKIFNKVNVYYCDNSILNIKKIKQIIQEVNPDYIYLNHLFSYKYVLLPLIIWWLNWQKKSKLVLAPRGALFQSALHYKKTYLKKRVVLILIKLFQISKRIHFHATNEKEYDVIKKEFPKSKISIANNLPSFYQQPISPLVKNSGEIAIIFIARIVAIKNLDLLLDASKKVKANISITIAGPIEDEIYWNQCKFIIESLPKNIKVNYVGSIKQNQIHELTIKHHLFCLPTQGENFGHSIFEAFLSGRPCLISNRTPWNGLENQHAGWDVEIQDTIEVSKCLTIAASWNQQEFDKHCKGAWQLAKDYLSNNNLIEPYLQMFS